MKKLLLPAIAAISMSFFLQSCDKEDLNAPFTLTIHAKMGTADFYLDSAYTIDNGDKIEYSLFNYYMSNIELIKTDGSVILLKDVELVRFDSKPTFEITGGLPVGDYNRIRFDLGLDSVTNAQDPNSYPPSHPLSILQSTYWDWNTMYRFTMSEGQFDTTGTGNNFNLTFTYHPGLNAQFREVSMNIPTVSVVENASSGHTINLQVIDMIRRSGDPIDMVNNQTTHCANAAEIALAARIMDNFVLSFSN